MKILDLNKFRVRKLTPTEYGRLQAFPMERWEQVVSDSQAYKQFGNAVTVNVVKAIAERLKGCLSESETTDLSDAPEEIKVQILQNNERLQKGKETVKALRDYSEEELLKELMRRQVANG